MRNQGNAKSNSTTLRYYRSNDKTISKADTFLGTDSVAGLNPGGSSTQSISLTAPNAYGIYWIGACVDAVAIEDPTSNNCSTGVQISVRPPFVMSPIYHLLLHN